MTTFKSHPLPLIKMQAEAMGLEHKVCFIDGPDHKSSYRERITELRVNDGIQAIITGDIEDVCSNFMGVAIEQTGVELVRPLFKAPRQTILDGIWSYEFNVIISCVNMTRFDETFDAAARLVGHSITKDLLQQVREYNQRHTKKEDQVDETGEYGEFHSMVMDAPLFKKKIIYEAETTKDGDYAYLLFNESKMTLIDKQ
eukprot:gene12203-14285_t